MPQQGNRIAVWLAVQEMPGGLPDEALYSVSFLGPPLGHAVLPEGMTFAVRADHVVLTQEGGVKRPEHVASLGFRRIAEAAVTGEFGLSWEPYGGQTS